MGKKLETAVFGGGCFWCTEAVFQNLKGVASVSPGYAGGQKENPTYEDVCTGTTGHAEVVQITYDPAVISYRDLLTVFFATHDPTTRNRQGNDVGTQYRSVILYETPEQKREAEKFIRDLTSSGAGGSASPVPSSPVVTEVAPLAKFYPAEDYHHCYFDQNPGQPYCQLVINPKLDKLKKRFSQLLKTSQ